MVTECCSAVTVISDNCEWCTGCGSQVAEHVQWVVGYNNPNAYRGRYPVYSRTKRFKFYLLGLNEQELYQNFEDIMNIFGLVEFHWGIKGCVSRKYFFNKACVLHFIASKLGLEISIRTLKDSMRVTTQVEEMGQLLNL